MLRTGGEGGRTQDSELALLVRRAKASDVAAFEQVLRLHERRVFLTALRLLDSAEDAQDAAQEVFLRLHKHLRRFDDTRELPLELAAAPPATDWRDERRIVAMGLRRLPEKERAALVLRDIEGLPTAEVARVLGSSQATVRSQVSSARLKIKRFAGRFLRRA